MTIRPLNSTLEQELNALLRGASLECLVCGEFVLHLAHGGIFCPECGSGLDTEWLPSPLNRVAWVSVVQVEDEVELCTAGPGLQFHRAALRA